jgi:hypothetical protein
MSRALERALVAAGLATILGVASAEAYRPLLTEDTGTVEPGRVEIEVSGDLERGTGEDRWSARAVVAVGLTARLEGRIDVGVGALDSPGERGHAGAQDTVVGLKYRLVDESGVRPAFMLASAVRLPTGNVEHGLGQDGVDVTGLAVASKTIAAVTIMVNAGRTFVTRDAALDTWIASVAADQPITGTLSIVAEVVSTFGARHAADTVVLRGGTIVRLSERLAIDAAVGVGLTAGSPDFQATAGLTLGF